MLGSASGFIAKLTFIVMVVGAMFVMKGVRSEGDSVPGADILAKAERFLVRVIPGMGAGDAISEDEAPSTASLVLSLNNQVGDVSNVVVAESPTVPGRCTVPRKSSDAVVVGDVLRVRFFETMAPVPENTGTSDTTAPATRMAFERLDLSGTYQVGQDGTVSIPLLGRTQVLDHELSCVEPMLEKAAVDSASIETRVSTAFASRPPVVAQGDLRSPGRYELLPGMTVQQLLSLAGAATSGMASTTTTNASMLAARQSELERALTSNLIKWHRIEAALEGADTLRLSSEQLASVRALLGPQRIEAEMLVLSTDNESRRAAERQRQSERDAIRTLLEARDQHLALVSEQLATVADRHARLVRLQEDGVISMAMVTDSELGKMAMERMLLEASAARVELQTRELQLTPSAEFQRLQERQELAAQLRAAVEDADGLQGQLEAVKQQLGSEEVLVDPVPAALSVTIERQEIDGTKRFSATLDTPIRAGDIVTVSLSAGSDEREIAQTLVDEGGEPAGLTR